MTDDRAIDRVRAQLQATREQLQDLIDNREASAARWDDVHAELLTRPDDQTTPEVIAMVAQLADDDRALAEEFRGRLRRVPRF